MTTTLYVEYRSYCLESRQAEEEYGDWYEQHDFDVTGGVTLEKTAFISESFTIDADVKVGDSVHVLWLTYSQGDSFGRSDGNGEVMWVFKDLALAHAATRKWQEAVRGGSQKDEYASITFEVDGGTTVTLGNPGWGYFECLERVQLTTMCVRGDESDEPEFEKVLKERKGT